MDVQADLSFCWTHMSESMFCHVAAHTVSIQFIECSKSKAK